MDDNNPVDAVVDTVEVDTVEVDKPEEPQPLFSDDEIQNIRAMKLSNGDDIIGTIKVITPHQILLRRPSKILRIANGDGTVNVILIKWHAFSTDETIPIQLTSLVSYSEVNEEMKRYYMKSVEVQIEEETKAAIASEMKDKYIWPEWMDQEITDKTKIN